MGAAVLDAVVMGADVMVTNVKGAAVMGADVMDANIHLRMSRAPMSMDAVLRCHML